MKKLFSYIRPNLPSMTLGLLIKILATVAELFIPRILTYILDTLVPDGAISEDRKIRLIILWSGAMFLCGLVLLFGNIIANRMAAYNSGKVTRAVRHDLFAKINYLSATQVDEITVPSLVSRLTSDSYNVNNMLSRIQRFGVRAPILIVGGVIFAFSLDVPMTVVLIALMPVISVIVYAIVKKSVPLYTAVQSEQDVMVRNVQENIVGARVIKALNKTEFEGERFDGVITSLSGKERSASLVNALTNPANSLILNLGLVTVLITGAFRVYAGDIGPAVILAFLTYFTMILNAMIGITQIFTSSSRGVASARRISDVLETPDTREGSNKLSYTEDSTAEKPDNTRSSDIPHMQFSNVSFSYKKVENNVEGINFTLQRGQTLGIIGACGSGKTTVIKLLLRLYDADSGEIFINGQPLRDIPEDRLHRMFGVVFQNDFIMADTIRENAAFLRDISDEDIWAAAETARAKNFISEKDGGLDHEVAIKGSNLSGGQKQRLLITRALAARPEILILDDSSSALDYTTDMELRRELVGKYKDCTKIIIAQRAGAIRNADHILVLDDGKIVGAGTHGELERSCPVYAEICAVQMGGALLD